MVFQVGDIAGDVDGSHSVTSLDSTSGHPHTGTTTGVPLW
jgi:hypothetical protein